MTSSPPGAGSLAKAPRSTAATLGFCCQSDHAHENAHTQSVAPCQNRSAPAAPAKRRITMVDAHRMVYLERGSAGPDRPTLVLIHGFAQ
ncbi:hypothetical protein [Marinobacter similis]|uniref:hypothetical protein n=1 Tax=Marinobacter similis TaxID=1420916 RepID=UPI000AB7EC20|nr:hypothetical protein [Marinobacter similis]